MSLPRLIRAACTAAALFASQAAFAVIIPNGDGSGNTTSAGAGDGWNYVGIVNGGSGIYLGNYDGGFWVLTANHVGAGNFTVGSNTYNYVTGSGSQVGTLDLRVFRIDVPPEDTTLLGLNNLSLSSTPPLLNSGVTMIGAGRDRQTSNTTWYVDVDTATWSESNFAGADAIADGYKWAPSARSKRWGTNSVNNPIVSSGTTYLVTDFDDNGSDAQAAVGDSGGGVFFFNGSSWELSGVMVGIQTFTGQPGETAVYGNTTVSISVANHRSQILAAVPEPGTIFLVTSGLVTITLIRRRKRVGMAR